MSQIDINLFRAIFQSFRAMHKDYVKPHYYEWDEIPVFLKAYQKVVSKYYSIYKFYVMSDATEMKYMLEVKFNVSRKTQFLFCNVSKSTIENGEVTRIVRYPPKYCKSNCRDEHISGGVPITWNHG